MFPSHDLGQEMERMSPDQIEVEVAHELLDLKKAAEGLDREIGDRSTPIPDIEENMFSSSAENTPVRRSKRKKGGKRTLKKRHLKKGTKSRKTKKKTKRLLKK